MTRFAGGRGAGALAAATIGVAVLSMAAPASPAAAAGSTRYFSASTSATAIHVALTQHPASSIILGSLVDDSAGYAASNYDSSGGSSEAQAAPFFPGNLVVQGPSLLCEDLFSCPASPPSYPLLADASYPRNKSASVHQTGRRVGPGAGLSVTPAVARSHAGKGGNEARTRTGDVRLLGGTPLAMSVGTTTATSRVSTSARSVTATARAVVSDVRIGTLLRIGSIVSVDVVRLGPGGKRLDRPQVSVQGVTVAGVPAAIDDHGIHIAGHRGGSLSKRLTRSGITVATVGVKRSSRTHQTRSSVQGLAVGLSLPVKHTPYVPNPLASVPPFDQVPGVDANGTYIGTVTFGAVGVVAASQAQSALGSVTPPQPGPATSHSTTANRTAGTPGTPGTPGVPGTPGTAGNGGGTPPQVAAAPSTGPVGFVDTLARDALESLYLVLALGSAALFLGWRLTVALRRHPLPLTRRG